MHQAWECWMKSRITASYCSCPQSVDHLMDDVIPLIWRIRYCCPLMRDYHRDWLRDCCCQTTRKLVSLVCLPRPAVDLFCVADSFCDDLDTAQARAVTDTALLPLTLQLNLTGSDDPWMSTTTGTVVTVLLPSKPWVEKTRQLTLAYNFTKYWPIFTTLSLLDSVGNL